MWVQGEARTKPTTTAAAAATASAVGALVLYRRRRLFLLARWLRARSFCRGDPHRPILRVQDVLLVVNKAERRWRRTPFWGERGSARARAAAGAQAQPVATEGRLGSATAAKAKGRS